VSLPGEPVSGTSPNLYKYIDITTPKLKLYTPGNTILMAGKIYKIGWKIYDKNLDISKNKLSVSYDNGKTWHLLAKAFAARGRIDFRTPEKDLNSSLLFKLEAEDFSHLSCAVVSKAYTVRKYDFDILFTEPTQHEISKTRKTKKRKKESLFVEKREKESFTKIEDHLTRAKILIAQGEYPDALQNLKTIVQIDPNNLEALSLMGYVHTLQEDYSQSIQILSRAFSLDCSNWTNFYNLEISLLKVNNIFDSLAKMTEFLKCVSVENLDKNKLDKIHSLIASLEKKSLMLQDIQLKNKLGYLKNLVEVSLQSANK
ncbi:MAG: tetratricopeptide repeat protein, partial [Planctomycetota bacterium]